MSSIVGLVMKSLIINLYNKIKYYKMITITDNYIKLQQKLHENPNYGIASISFAPVICNIIKSFKIKTLSDYGAGKQNLIKALISNGIILDGYYPYDPAFPNYGSPKSADLICCIDVLEHIEPDYIDNVIKELYGLVDYIGFISIHMGPAGKFLEDGRNAHLIQKPTSWWLNKFIKYFDILNLSTHNINGNGFSMIIKRCEFKGDYHQT